MTDRSAPQKEADAYRTIGEVAEELKLPQHVLRFWETRFPQIKPMKRAGGRRFYRPEDVALLRAVQALLYGEGYTIKGVQRLFGEFGARHVGEALARSGEARAVPADPSEDPTRDEGTAPAMPKDDATTRRDAGIGAPRPTPARAKPPAAGAALPERRPELAARLEGVLADLSECARLLSSVRSTRD